MHWLEVCSQIAEIGTAVVAVAAAFWYWMSLRRKRRALEDYLEKEMLANPRRYGENDRGRRTIMHLIAHLKMTEEEILQAAFRSEKIHPTPATGANNRAEAVYLEHKST